MLLDGGINIYCLVANQVLFFVYMSINLDKSMKTAIHYYEIRRVHSIPN